jgi:arsenate reductase
LEAFSAGILPSRVHPYALAVMAEAGVDISGHRSKHRNEVKHLRFDLVVTLCSDADELCPVFPWKFRLIHRAFRDPVGSEGMRDEVLAGFRKTRDEIRAFVETLPDLLDNRSNKEHL